ncbi:MAG: 2-C-methyl-D-erythritol 4-phosphate cytidylyltransferase [Cyanobacteriota bacterium]
MHLLIAAAGSGRRMGANGNKLLLPLAGRPLLAWTLEAALACGAISWIGVVGQPVDAEAIAALVADVRQGSTARSPLAPVVWIVGGDTRQDSVRLGLAALPDDAKQVLIHDGARCLVEPELLQGCCEALGAATLAGAGIIAATPVTDTIKEVGEGGRINGTPDRSLLWAAQTPQGFAVDRLRQAHAKAEAGGWTVTDDAALYERLGWPVQVLEAPPSNIKVTTPFDLTVAEAVLKSRGSWAPQPGPGPSACR